MRDILRKEMTLSASPVTYFFIVFGLMFFLPGYPVLCSVFFVTLGIFKTFQNAREANDLVFSALLPIAKKDVVKGKYLFTCMIELVSFAVMSAVVLLRMTVLKDLAVYRENALMNANLFALGAGLFLFGLFNLIFLGGFFRTAYKFVSFIRYIVAAFAAVIFFEAVHYVPGLGAVNAFGFAHLSLQLGLLIIGALSYLVFTMVSYRYACRSFEKIDL
ncbi:MAG: ABC-2 transporter permease [Eubacteriaceae bacterium]|jgi:hypothetical protein|uniref:ABC-2 transporter permease n=1 Tax=Candidatus Pseudoramibacter fermentans TaxID=2594427 RepID=A0A6L5GSQ2_9FIRM|nr:ABC-2 transporter permease [Candidatus Pseudoramibacter fermentans]RRF93140.1 MAG: ABC-2 transporter permease [Eubacteriaceae bacterium]